MPTDWTPFLTPLKNAALAVLAFLLSLDGYALLLAVIAPILLIYARHEILIRRLRTILDFMQSFKLYGTSGGCAPRSNPSFEFVKSKYVSDIKIGPEDQERLDKVNGSSASAEEERLKLYIACASRSGSRTSKQIYLSSIGFMLVTYFGMRSLIGAFACDFRSISACESPATISDQMLVIGSLAFAGAFVGSLRMLLRCLAVYDLSAFSMLRHTAEIIFTVIFVMLIFRAFPDPLFNVGKLLLPDAVVTQIESAQATTTTVPATNAAGQPPQPQVQPTMMADPGGGIPWLWFALAPALGLLPASATRFLLMKMQSLVSWMKTTDDRFMSVSRVTSLDIIDGIDFETRFRLEECGIYDVQNLATYNPVMLHIETPYGIYQAIDWIAQAQLCHIVGQEKFLMFREVNIRTIFDLERAIDSVRSPHAFDNIYASILFAPTDNLKKAAAISQFRFLITDSRNLTRQVSVEEYCAWAREQLRTPLADDATKEVIAENENRFAEAVEHLMVWISDDLHIRRLRRLWLDISDSLGKEAEHFPDSKRLPIKPGPRCCEPKPDCCCEGEQQHPDQEPVEDEDAAVRPFPGEPVVGDEPVARDHDSVENVPAGADDAVRQDIAADQTGVSPMDQSPDAAMDPHDPEVAETPSPADQAAAAADIADRNAAASPQPRPGEENR